MRFSAARRSHIVGAVALAALIPLPAARAADCTGGTTQMDLNQCAAADLAKADAALNAAYGRLLKSPGLTQRLDGLRAAERAWVEYRDAQCGFEGAAVEGGSMQPMVIDGCARVLTERRTADLKAILACGGESC